MKEIEFKLSAFITIAILAIVTFYPVILEYRSNTAFSELGVLGPDKKLSNYPNDLKVGQNFNLYLYLENHEGELMYYRVVAKQGDRESTINEQITLNSTVIAYWDYILINGEIITNSINLSMPNAGLNQRLVFELYAFDPQNNSFTYNHIWTQLWMNVTLPG
jgi:uncharacterized membrane protein